MSASLETPIHCEDTPSEFSWNPWFWMIFRTKTLISMFRLEDTGSKMSGMLGNPWKSMISGRFAWIGIHANRLEIIDSQGFLSISDNSEPVSSSLSIEINVFVLTFLALSSMCLRVWIQKSQVYSEFIIFSHNIIQNHKFLDVGDFGQDYGWDAGEDVGRGVRQQRRPYWYSSTVDRRATSATSTILRQLYKIIRTC